MTGLATSAAPLVDVLEFHLDARGADRLGFGSDEYNASATEHPMASAQYASGLAYLAHLEDGDRARALCEATLDRLVDLRPTREWCWGLGFLWRDRDANHPYAVTTAMCGIAFLDGHDLGIDGIDVAWRAGRWLVDGLPWAAARAGAAPHYSPMLPFALPNVAAVVAAFLLRLAALTGDPKIRSRAEDALDFVLATEESGGYWLYGETDDAHATNWPRPQDIIDAIHTAYVFEGLVAGMRCDTRRRSDAAAALARGIDFVNRAFMRLDGKMRERLAVADNTLTAEQSSSIETLEHEGTRVIAALPVEARLWSYGALLGVLSADECVAFDRHGAAARVCGNLLRTKLSADGRFRYRSGDARFFPRHEAHAFAGLARYAFSAAS